MSSPRTATERTAPIMPDDALCLADEALYRAKQAGPDLVTWVELDALLE